ncbi:RagB/SusD family nutrient uptake outer membrane protein [Pedobacter nyackensis]|uniref:RagB/SusD family nutrient uptake outer membrane protein n=1 Tax=Pedobacter nyackensis TaxID=475255 RepID=UPI00292FA462|nr:RagB/SusD family nutrient uptake outer membrane protein [Pedobacter nyackensis]
MKLNIKYIVLVLLIALTGTSCQKFLDVKPRTEMPQDVLFSTESGFKDALTGVYIQLKSDAGYGKALTMTTLEQLISSWDVTANSTEQRLGLYNFADAGVQQSLANVFGQQYKVIASINAILGHIDAKKSVFKPGMYEMIKGECLALRAYCHFDVLRLFGPVPTATSIGNQLPYVTVLSNTPNAPVSFETFKTAMLKDLAEAEALQRDVDPFTKYSMDDFKLPSQVAVFKPEDDFISYRYLRMNYYAVKALQARAYLWFNDKAKAYESAKFLIDVKNINGTQKFRLGNSSDMTNKDYVLTAEHIFGLYDFDLYTKYGNTFGNGTLKKGTAEATIKNQLYGNSGTDIREANLWELITLSNNAKCYVLKKYQVEQNPSRLAADFKQIPMLRISEMYMIAIESAPLGEAQNLWAAYRNSRNISVTTLPADPVQLQMELLKEYRKEFYAEGQAFYAYKRVNALKGSVLFTPSNATVNYLLPLPKTESSTAN